MIKRSLCLLLPLLLFLNCSKTTSTDDLKSKIGQIVTLQKKAKANVNDSTLLYIKKVNGLIKSTENIPDSLIIENIFRKGYYYSQIKERDSAAHYFYEAITLAKDAVVPPERELVYYRETCENDLYANRYANCISTINTYVDIVSKREDPTYLMYAYNILERIHRIFNDYEKALFYNEKTQKIATFCNDIEMSSITSSAKASLLSNKLNRNKEALVLLDSISKNHKKYSDNTNRQLFSNYAISNYHDSNYPEAIKNYKKSIFYNKKDTLDIRYEKYMLENYLNIAEAFIVLKKHEAANKYLDSASLHIDTKSKFDLVSFLGELKLRLSYGKGIEINRVIDDYYGLVDGQNKIHIKRIQEELSALKVANKNQEILEVENQEKEINNLKLKSGVLILIVLISLLSLLGFLFFRNRKYKFEKQSLQMQQRLLRSQMSPHFTFNTLYAIQNKIKEDQEGSINYLVKFSRLLRLILENSMINYVQLEKEIESLQKYMDLQLLRFPNKFDYSITFENLDEDDLVFIPPMLIQPFVENSIEHGFLGIDYKGNVSIKLALQKKHILCTITDNGIGLKKANNSNKTSASTGLISDFILKATKNKVKISDRRGIIIDASGVVVEFLIPYKLTEYD
jgi:tetratricopeptide (TPR) repeat protein